MKIECILIDLDGTIFDFSKSERYSLEKCFTVFGYCFTNDIYEQYSLINHDLWQKFEKNELGSDNILIARFEILFKLLGYPIGAQKFSERYQSYLSDSCELVDSAMEILDYLYKKYKLYVVTNGIKNTQMKRLKKAGIINYFNEFFISETMGVQKPSKEFFDICFGRIDEKRESTIIIGDSLTSDMVGGNIAGIFTCWYNPQKLINRIQADIDYEINSLVELMKIL